MDGARRRGAACRLDIALDSSTLLKMEVGDGDRYPYKSEITNEAGEVISIFTLQPDTIV